MSDAGDLDSGSVTFVDNYRSELPDGDYEVLVGQRVSGTPGPTSDGSPSKALPFDETFFSRQRLRVQGPRFSLPADMVSTHFPPAESTGEYEAVLPHVVLKRKTLPWERSATPTGTKTDPPWLAVLVFHASDVASGMAQPWQARAGTVGELHQPGPGVLSYPDVAATGSPLLSEPCQIIDLPVALWARVAPSCADMAWLAHGREVTAPQDPNHKADAKRAAGTKLPPDTEAAVVVANRLPHANDRCTAHLVSLEGLGDALPGGPNMPRQGIVRLVSLTNWSFASRDEATTFDDQVNALNVGPLQLPLLAGATDSAQQLAAQALSLGYAALQHHTRAGERTISWYRGPCLPYQVEATGFKSVISLGQPVHTADELVRMDPRTGLFDMSYAAAWQLGRLLLLQNTSVATALAQWKHANVLQGAVAAEHTLLRGRWPFLDLPEVEQSKTGHAAGVRGAAAHQLARLGHVLTEAARVAARSPTATDAAATAPAPVLPQAASAPKAHKSFHSEAHIGSSTHRASGALPSTVTLWLKRLRSLHGVPAAYIVAGIGEKGSLPAESLRLFELDWNWIYALVEGAFSVGRTCRATQAHDAAQHDSAHAPGEGLNCDLDHPAHDVSGCLLHSKVLAEWPDLQLQAFDAASRPLKTLSTQRLGARILLTLFQGRVARIDLREPPHGLHFGIAASGPAGAGRRFDKPLRLPGLKSEHAGPAPVLVPFRDSSKGVLDVDGLFKCMKKALPVDKMTSAADFALQMVEGSQAVSFHAENAQPSPRKTVAAQAAPRPKPTQRPARGRA